MNKIKLLVIAMTVMLIVAASPAASAQSAQSVQQLEKDIEQHEKNIKEKETSIKDLEERIDNLKSQLKDLENQTDVLYSPYNKSDIDEALESFEGMETKDVIKHKELVEKYGEYTKDLKEFMEKFKKQLAENRWKYVSSSSDLYKKFEKGLKGTKYWKIYNKKEKNESIDYLDRVMDKIMMFKNDGLKSEAQFNECLNMLYAN